MAKKSGTGMKQQADRKTRGRTSITGNVGVSYTGSNDSPSRSKPNVPEVLQTEANRPVKAGTGHRGDRRDTSKTYTNNTRHAARGNTPRADVKTRAR